VRRTSFNTSASSGVSASGIFRATVVSVGDDDLLRVKIPKLGLNNVYEGVSYAGPTPAAGDVVFVGFLEGKSGSFVAFTGVAYEGNAGDPVGDITSVVAGTNLNGGGSSGTVTVNLDSDITLTSVTADDFYGDLHGAIHILVKNLSGGPLTKGAPVYATGAVGASGAVEVQASLAGNASTMPAMGLLDQDLANNGEGHVVVSGVLENIDTATPGYSVGVDLYVDVSGGLTTTRPTGSSELVQKVGKVIRVQQNSGEILVQGAGRTNDVPNGTLANDISGNAATATALETARTIDITGDITATAVAFDGTANIAISASVNNDSHTHDTRYLLNTTDTLSGDLTVTGVIDVNEVHGDNGSTTDPSFTFTDDQDTGMYRYGANAIGFTAGGGLKVLIDSSGTYGRLFGPGFRNGSAIIRGENTAAIPTYTFYGDENTGMYWQSSDVIAWSTGGTKRALLYSGGFRINVSGSAGTPAFHWEGDTNTGMYRVTTDQVGFSAGGTLKGRFWSQGLLMGSASTGNAQLGTGTGSAGAPVYQFYNDTNTGMYRVGSDRLGFTTGGAARMYIQNSSTGLTGASGRGVSIRTTGATEIYRQATGAADGILALYSNNGSTADLQWLVYGDGDTASDTGVYGTISDNRLKTNIAAYKDPTDDLMAINVIKYDLSKTSTGVDDNGDPIIEDLDTAKTMTGWDAQQVQSVKPGFVKLDAERGILSVKSSVFVPLLHRGFQVHEEKIAALEARIAALEAQ
jgi:hypothetical protein